MDRFGNWSNSFTQTSCRQTDQSVSPAEIGDLVEFVNPWLGLSLWGVYVGDDHVIHFGVGGDRILKKTRICTQRIAEIKLPAGTRIRINNNKHNLVPSPQEMMRHRCDTSLHQEFKYDLMNFNSKHFATFVRYGQAVCNQIPFKSKNEAHTDTTQTLQMIMQQRWSQTGALLCCLLALLLIRE